MVLHEGMEVVSTDWAEGRNSSRGEKEVNGVTVLAIVFVAIAIILDELKIPPPRGWWIVVVWGTGLVLVFLLRR